MLTTAPAPSASSAFSGLSILSVATADLDLGLDPRAHQGPADPIERVGFKIGWDHAHHGLVPPPEWLGDGSSIARGWRAGRAVFGARTLAATRAVRQWLALRLRAWQEGVSFESEQLTPHFIGQLHAERCPVLRLPLGGAAGDPAAAVIVRLNPFAGYAAGNLATLSRRAAQALADVDVLEALRRAYRCTAGEETVEDIDVSGWLRLAALRSFTTALPFHEASRLPLAVLPPNRVRLLNGVQGLQMLLTLLFARPGWAARARAVADGLPAHSLRQDFHLFVGALAPRVVEAGCLQVPIRQALEDAWLHERVQRRWQHFVSSLGEAATASLLERVTALGVAGGRVLVHGNAQATEGWELDAGTLPPGQAESADRGHRLQRRAANWPGPRAPALLNPSAGRPAGLRSTLCP